MRISSELKLSLSYTTTGHTILKIQGAEIFINEIDLLEFEEETHRTHNMLKPF